MNATLTSSLSSSRSSTFSNTSNIDNLGRSSPSHQQSSERLSPSSDSHLSTCHASTSTGGRPHADRDNSSQAKMKRFIFGDYNIDWRSIPAVDEDVSLNRATLYYRRDLRCKASRDYYMEILNGFRVATTDLSTYSSSPDSNTIIIDGEEIVDMIG